MLTEQQNKTTTKNSKNRNTLKTMQLNKTCSNIKKQNRKKFFYVSPSPEFSFLTEHSQMIDSMICFVFFLVVVQVSNLRVI